MSQRLALRLFVVVFGTLACAWAAYTAARFGLARMFADYAIASTRLDAADVAVRLSPADAETHYARAVVLSGAGRDSDAITEYGRAATLRPHDYALWIALGRARDSAGDTEGALAAFRAAESDAPYYAQPSWQLGNTLLRADRREDAQAELRRAAESDPRLFPNFVDLAWHAAGGDARAFVEAASPRTTDETLVVARFLVAHGETGAAMSLLRPRAGALGDDARHALVRELIAAGSFAEAFEVWAGGGVSKGASPGALVDGGFEQPLRFEETGFGWQIARARAGDAVKFSLDSTEPRAGARSLRLDFAGGSPTDVALVSQLIVVEPGARYRLSFAARTTDLVAGGLPLIRVMELRAKGESATLADSPTLPEGASGGWRTFSVEFTTTQGARAVSVSLVRHNCTTSPCPAFGHLWLDDFSLTRL